MIIWSKEQVRGIPFWYGDNAEKFGFVPINLEYKGKLKKETILLMMNIIIQEQENV